MCSEKSAVSILQELAVKFKLALPVYDITTDINGFMSTVRFCNQLTSAVGKNKKKAKRLSAERLVEIIEKGTFEIVETVPVLLNTVSPPVDTVSRLNQYCSQRYLEYPSYTDRRVLDGTFLVLCTLHEFFTAGSAVTKKDAKQIAAKKMLDRLELSIFSVALSSTKLSSETGKRVVDLHAKLSSKHVEFCSKSDGLKQHKNVLQLKPLNEAEVELLTKLQRMDVRFTISQLQPDPLIVILKTEEADRWQPRIFFNGAGDNYEQARLDLLRHAVDFYNMNV